MTTIKAYTDLSQSKALSKMLPIESADMYYWLAWRGDVSKEIRNTPKVGTPNKDAIKTYWCPCWSLVALLEQLNKPTLFRDFDGWTISCLSPSSHMPMIKSGFASPIDACVVMLKMIHDVEEHRQKANRKDEGEESKVKGNRYYENGDILPHAI